MTSSLNKITRFVESYGNSTAPVRVRTTKGDYVVKAMGNPAGEHSLACEWVGSHLAKLLGLSTFDFEIVHLEDDVEMPFCSGGYAKPGPCFGSAYLQGQQWSGNAEDLKRITNRNEITGLILADTWFRNVDRHSVENGRQRKNVGNVFLALNREVPGGFRLVAMDFSHAFVNGRDLTAKVDQIAHTKDPELFGLFPEFAPYLCKKAMADFLERMSAIDTATIREICRSVPHEWQVEDSILDRLADFLIQRRIFLQEHFPSLLFPQYDLPL